MNAYTYASLRYTCTNLLALVFCALAATQAFVAQERTSATSQRIIKERNDQVIVNTDLITFNVSVTDNYGRAVTGLGKNAFTVFDNQVHQEIQFFSDEDAPASIGIVFDTSGSMSGDKINQAKEALAHFIKTSHERDEFFLIDFNSRAHLLLDKTRDSDAVLKKFTYVEPQGNTALYDAVYLGLEKVMRGAHRKRILLVISDGENNDSRYTFKEIRRQLKESDVIIYSIGLGGYFFNIRDGINGREVLKELSSTSGGKAFFPNGEDEMYEAFYRIALEVRHLYSIGYYPSNFTADGKWRCFKVKVALPSGSQRVFVRSREGYYAGTNP